MENCRTSYLSEDASDDVYLLMLRISAVQETSVVTVKICTEELLMELLGMMVIITLVTGVFLLSCTWSKDKDTNDMAAMTKSLKEKKKKK
ncbi:ubiquitin carboxyl-terminal hydrolase 8-like isoform X1 [Canna indica]|uniref:Ubiquitin carboxyl-terminal hydrolase 8-like isoform X1 n=1 Tax=Canna indica TaxID=4628 RepID=A0AAQ3JR16_9LILI|nr:ubiquitin carboxyl-terminal hydrolase 8-like isoform X1 [Canna indica]